ncbi:glycosyl transferase family 2 [bacterium]|nr:glycosyl transferase family 2 [bacterium]|tara:strand:+ start:2298 stop:3119 length:822 start_codon:yes stop_codon:yes gene_type:complete
MKISVILITYKKFNELNLTLSALENQTKQGFEVVVAEDDDSQETKEIIKNFKKRGRLDLKHVFQKDNGYQRSKIVNKGIIASKGDYLLFLDSDCVPRSDWVESYAKSARKGWFFSGGSVVHVPESIHSKLQSSDVKDDKIFNYQWLKDKGLSCKRTKLRLSNLGIFRHAMDFLTTRLGVFTGGNSACWKKDALSVNGFDEDFVTYGSEDREFGARLVNFGLKGIVKKFSFIVVHLDHPRPYSDDENIKNRKIMKKVMFSRKSWAENGIRKLKQ